MSEIKSGWMHKCGKAVKSWKKRWFILKPNGYLYYYEGPGKAEKGKIDVIDAAKVAPWQEVGTAERKLPSNLSGSNAFAIVAADRTYTCCCEQEGESLAWMSAIEKVQGAAASGEQQYPPPTYTEDAQVKHQDPLMSAPPPYTPTSPQHSSPQGASLNNGPPPPQVSSPPPQQASAPPQQQTAPPPQQQTPPFAPTGMPDPTHYGGAIPIGVAAGTSNPAGGPGYQGAYPVGSYQQRPPQPPPPRPQYQQPPPPRPQYQQPPPPRPQYQQPPRPGPQYYQQRPPPRPQYYQQPPPRPGYYPPPRPAYQSYPQRPPPTQQYYRPPPPVQQQSTTNVTVITLSASQTQGRVVYR